MNYKTPVLEKLKEEKNITISTTFLRVMLAKFKNLVDYEFTNIELLLDLSEGILFDEFALMIQIYQSSKITINKF